MTSVVAPIEHIVIEPTKDWAMVKGTRLSVMFLSTFIGDPEWPVERMVANYPLTEAQIYAAWSYYYDHKEEIDRQLREEEERPWLLGVDASEYFAEAIERRRQRKLQEQGQS
jgi:uncharacterized protein (DUF433 family)